MRFHPTLKLAQKLRIDSLTSCTGAPGDLASWYANLFRVDRVQFVLFTNPPSLFSLLVFGRGISSSAQLCEAFEVELRDYLAPVGLYEPYCLAVGPGLLQRKICKTGDRAVLGSMNSMIDICKWYINDGDGYRRAMANLLNQTPYKLIRYRRPVDVFCSLLLQGAGT